MNRVGSFVVVGMSLLGLQLSGCGGGGEGDSVTKSAPTIQELAKTDAAIANAAPDCPADYKKISINKMMIMNYMLFMIKSTKNLLLEASEEILVKLHQCLIHLIVIVH